MPEIYDAAHLGRALRDRLCLQDDGRRFSAQCPTNAKRFQNDERGLSSRRTSNAKRFQNDGRVLPLAGWHPTLRVGYPPTDREGAIPQHILIPRAAAGSPELIAELGDEFFIDDIPTYETRYESSRFVDLSKEFASGEIDYVLFTSASTVRGFAAAVEETSSSCGRQISHQQGVAPEIDFTKIQAICIGKQTEAAAAALGMKTWVAAEASIHSLIERLCEVRQGIR
ncbi:MAG: uroporphyrinogen-III synthase [Lachnospiraceae bacterium]|nr:uroporphyrinogen-III synthase [Lachnospiraceae bacterium]